MNKIKIAQAYIAGKYLLDKYAAILSNDKGVVLAEMAFDMEFFPYQDHSFDPAIWEAFLNFSKKLIDNFKEVSKDTEYSIEDAYKAFNFLLVEHNQFLAEDEFAVFKDLSTKNHFLPGRNKWDDFLFFAQEAQNGKLSVVSESQDEYKIKNQEGFRDWLLSK